MYHLPHIVKHNDITFMHAVIRTCVDYYCVLVNNFCNFKIFFHN